MERKYKKTRGRGQRALTISMKPSLGCIGGWRLRVASERVLPSTDLMHF
jgi:hypothetical protein